MTNVMVDGSVLQSATVVTPASDCSNSDLPRTSRLSRPLDDGRSTSPTVPTSSSTCWDRTGLDFTIYQQYLRQSNN